MDYYIIGKKGAQVNNIVQYLKEEHNIDTKMILPSELKKLNGCNTDYKVIYIEVPFRVACEWLLTDPYNKDLHNVISDEIWEFYGYNHWDFKVEFPEGFNFRDPAEKIADWIRKENMV